MERQLKSDSGLINPLNEFETSAIDKQLFDAVKNRNFKEIKTLLLKGADVNSRHYDMVTVLHIAAEVGDNLMIEILLKIPGIKLNLKDTFGFTPFLTSVACQQYHTANLLLKHGSNVNTRDRIEQTALHIAVLRKNIKMVKLLMQHKADVNAIDCFSRSPLRYSILLSPCPGIAKLLLRNGARPPGYHIVGGVGFLNELILWATKPVDQECIRMLLRYGVDPNRQEPIGHRSPLHFAALTGNTDTIETLLEAGADASLIDNRGQIPLDVAIFNCNYRVAEILEAHENADVIRSPIVVRRRSRSRIYETGWGKKYQTLPKTGS